MPIDVDWRVGPSDEEAPPAEAPTPTVLPKRRGTLATWGLAVLYGSAIVVAAWFGFQLGQWSDARSSGLADVTAQMEVEALSWREGDVDLYATTLDPDAPRAWRQDLAWAFLQEAPMDVRLTADDLQLVRPGVARATVTVTAPRRTVVEQRMYRRSGSSWYRTPEPDALDSASGASGAPGASGASGTSGGSGASGAPRERDDAFGAP